MKDDVGARTKRQWTDGGVMDNPPAHTVGVQRASRRTPALGFTLDQNASHLVVSRDRGSTDGSNADTAFLVVAFGPNREITSRLSVAQSCSNE
jgi:hypothetical protein